MRGVVRYGQKLSACRARPLQKAQGSVANRSTINKTLPATNAIRARPRPKNEQITLKNTRGYPQCTHGLTYIDSQSCQGCRMSHLI